MAMLANMYGLTFNNVHGQPALLYLVPGTLLPTIARAHALGHLREMWSGPPEDELFSTHGKQYHTDDDEAADDESMMTSEQQLLPIAPRSADDDDDERGL